MRRLRLPPRLPRFTLQRPFPLGKAVRLILLLLAALLLPTLRLETAGKLFLVGSSFLIGYGLFSLLIAPILRRNQVRWQEYREKLRTPTISQLSLIRIVLMISAFLMFRLLIAPVVVSLFSLPTRTELGKQPGSLVWRNERIGSCQVSYLTTDLNRFRPVLVFPSPPSAKSSLVSLARQYGLRAGLAGTSIPEPLTVLESPDPTSREGGGEAAFLTVEDHHARISVEAMDPNAYISGEEGVAYPLQLPLNSPYVPGQVGLYSLASSLRSAGLQDPFLLSQLIQARIHLRKRSSAGSVLRGQVEEVWVGAKSGLMEPKPGEIIAAIANPAGVRLDQGAYAWAARALQYASPVQIYLRQTPLSAPSLSGTLIMRYGQNLAPTGWSGRKRQARTAVGLTADGNHLLIVLAEGSPPFLSARTQLFWSYLGRGSFRQALAGLGDLLGLSTQAVGQYLSAALGTSQLSSGMSHAELVSFMQDHPIAGSPISSSLCLKEGDGGELVIQTSEQQSEQIVAQPSRSAPLSILGFKP